MDLIAEMVAQYLPKIDPRLTHNWPNIGLAFLSWWFFHSMMKMNLCWPKVGPRVAHNWDKQPVSHRTSLANAPRNYIKKTNYLSLWDRYDSVQTVLNIFQIVHSIHIFILTLLFKGV